jgi:hypothetical protein
VRVLELGAIDLDAGFGVAEERLGNRLDNARLAGAGRSEEQEVADWAPGSVHARQKHLIDFSNFFDRLVLADDFAAKVDFEVASVIAAAGWVKHGSKVSSHSLRPLIPFRKLQSFWKIAHFCHLGGTVLLSSPATVLCTPFANSPNSLSPMFLVDLDASSAILIDLRFGGQIL